MAEDYRGDQRPREQEELLKPDSSQGRAGTAVQDESADEFTLEPVAANLAEESDEDYDTAEDDDDQYEDEDEDEERAGFVRMRRPAFLVGATLLGLALLALLAGNVYQFMRNRNDQVVATVNGTAISQRDFNRTDGSANQTLDSLISAKLITQEAKRQKVNVPNSEIDSQIAGIKKQLGSDQEFRTALQRNSLTESQLRGQIRTQSLAQKMGAPNVTVSDAEAQTFYNQNKAQFGQQTFDQVKDQVKTQLLQQKQGEAIQNWIDGLRQKAKIVKHLPT
ncbi:MAG: SurA N-terminal domain-containing protein [Dehalococcoidia bacterium]